MRPDDGILEALDELLELFRSARWSPFSPQSVLRVLASFSAWQPR